MDGAAEVNMSHLPHRHPEGETVAPGDTMSPHTALRIAWVAWLVMLISPFALFLWMLWSLGEWQSRHLIPKDNTGWFLASSFYLIIAVPFSFFWRGHIFKAYWIGKPVSANHYLFGMISIWVALEIGGLVSLFGCVATHTMLPNLMPAMIAFMFFVTLWPNGRAMIKPAGQYNDPEFYQEPK